MKTRIFLKRDDNDELAIEYIKATTRRENGRISAQTGHINKTGVPKEAQDNVLSNGTSGRHQTPTGRLMGQDTVSMGFFLSVLVFLKPSGIDMKRNL